MSSQPGTPPASSSGQNEWLVEEMFAQYQQNPTSVSESWRDFFADYRPMSGHAGGTGELRSHGASPTNGAGPDWSSPTAAPAATPAPTAAPQHAAPAPVDAPPDSS